MSGTVILADEYPIVLDGLESLLHKSDFKILARCTTGEETLRALRRYRSDILVFDIHIPLKNGLEILREMKESKLPARSVVFTARLNDDEILVRSLTFGHIGTGSERISVETSHPMYKASLPRW
jgi:DNA-binding NarL/FixJ family response regulator